MGLMPGWAGEGDVLAGTGLPEDIVALSSSLSGGDWVAAELHGLSVGLGAVGVVIDPVGALAAVGAGWAIEHIDPLRTWLDDLAGDPSAVTADSARLDDTSRAVASQSQDLRATSAAHLAGMEGLTIRACQGHVQGATRQAKLLADLVSAGAAAMRIASGIVETVRTLVRDAISEVIGLATSSAVTVVFSAGLATPVIVGRMAWRVRELTLKLGSTMKAMAHSFEALRLLLARAESALAALARSARAGRGAGEVRPYTGPPVTWSSEMQKRLESIKPRAKAAETLPGAVVTFIEGAEAAEPSQCGEPPP